MSYDWHTENVFCITDTDNEGIFDMVRIGNIFFIGTNNIFYMTGVENIFIPLALTV